METEDARLVLVFNGEIYNYKELRRSLEDSGARFKTNSDTEVILLLHRRDGDAAISKLNGIFAYALWDSLSRRLLVVRDRAGVKPLYFSCNHKGFAFASEVKALFHSGIFSPGLNESVVPEYLVFNHIAGSHTLFSGVCNLPPGHFVEVNDGQIREPRQYWSVFDRPPTFHGTYTDALDELDTQLTLAVRRQMISDVPLGTFCSGGIDSSLITALAARTSNAALNTFSVGFAEQNYDESAYAREVASLYGTRHHELRITEKEYVSLLPKLIWHHDFPLHFPNSVHIFAVSQLARNHVTVVLTGEGADELFAGYPRYYIPRLLAATRIWPISFRRLIARYGASLPDHRLRKLVATTRCAEDAAIVLNCANLKIEFAEQITATTGALEARHAMYRMATSAAQSGVEKLMELDFRTYLCSILDRQDKMSMATSLEARVPFLDNKIVEFARSLPLKFKQTLTRRKAILQDMASRYLPKNVVRRPKSGFGVPIETWFCGRGPMAALLAEALSSQEIRSLVDTDVLRLVRKSYATGNPVEPALRWSIVNLYLWRRSLGI